MPPGIHPHEVEAYDPATLFVDPECGFPIGFFLHESIKKPFKIANLTRDIENHGGMVFDSRDGADTILVDTMYEDRETLQISYDVDPTPALRKIWVEPESFVRHCIKDREFRHRLRPRKGMGGMIGDHRRVEFTADDDEHLCRYIAKKIPFKEAGGRTGNELYKDLVKIAKVRPNDRDCKWVKRHTWQSWRERYKKNAPQFDGWISEIVALDPPDPKGLYRLDRRLGKGGRGRIWIRQRERQRSESQSDGFEGVIPAEGDEVEEEEVDKLVNQEDRTTNLQQKRMRQEGRRHSLPAAPPSKRQRKTRHSEPGPANDDDETDFERQEGNPERLRGQRIQSNGSDRDDDYDESMDNLGPYSEQRPPSPTLVNTQQPHAQRSSTVAPQLSPPATFVATSPPAASGSGTSRARPDSPNSARSLNRNNEVIELSDDEEEQPISAQIQPPRILRSRNPEYVFAPSRGLPQAATSEIVESVPVHTATSNIASSSRAAQTSSRPATVAARKIATRPSPEAVIPVVETAPYRNTRSRSRSVEPSVLPLPTRKRRKRKARQEEEEEQDEERDDRLLEPVAEGSLEEEAAEAITLSRTAETFEDEMDVAGLLFVDVNDVSIVSNPEAQTLHTRQDSLATDDAQTDRNLRGHSMAQTDLSTTYEFGMHPDDILRQFGISETKQPRRSVPLTSQAPMGNRASTLRQEASKPRRSEPFPLRGAGIHNSSSTPRRAAPTSTSRSNRDRSTSSSETFPMSGTRASAMKKVLEHHEKHTPYTPPEGTRAARFVPPS